MSYRFAYPTTTTHAGVAGPVNGYGVDPSLLSSGYPTGVPATMYNDHRRQ